MSQLTRRRQDLSAPRTSYENMLASLSNDRSWRPRKLTSKSSSGVAKEVASTKLTTSADRSTAVHFRVSLVSSIISNIIIPKEFKSAEVCLRIYPYDTKRASNEFGWYYLVESNRFGREDEITDVLVRWRG
jgi:hypothetical protein